MGAVRIARSDVFGCRPWKVIKVVEDECFRATVVQSLVEEMQVYYCSEDVG